MNLHDGLWWFVRVAMLAAALGVAGVAGAQTLSADDQYLWLVPNAANTQQQGFVRLINRSDALLPVTLWGLDAAGVRSPGTVTLTLAPHESRQMNSQDLEFGNADKGLTGALGSGSGDWTLVVQGSLDLEALAYIRTPGGFLTSMHDRVRGDGSQWWVPMFNPADNPNQRSRLRIVNTEETAVDLSIEGIDDLGVSGAAPVSLTLAPLAAVELDAGDLESGNPDAGVSGGFGAGFGKWQLRVNASGRISVQSLLRDPNGNLTNLSSLPDLVETAPGQRNVWLVPNAANAAQQGFVRLLNRENRSGEVMLWGIDDAGQRSPGTITLTLAPNESRQLNSQDLESGNAAKEIVGSLGQGTGNWRLVVASDLDLLPLGYIRTPNGFLTSIHDTVAGDGVDVEVPIFNPGENRNQVSLLRLVNPNAGSAQVQLSGRDDAGAAGGSVTLTLAAGSAVSLSAQDLEDGNAGKGLSGSLGDGNGKWRLSVSANLPVRVMSLLNDPQGFLTNLSRASRGDGAALEPLPASPADPVFRVSAATPFVAGCDGEVSGGTAFAGAEVEPQAAANPRDLRNLVGAWQQDRWSNGGARGIVAAASFDGGKSWTQTALPFTRCGGGNAGNGGNFARASDPWISFAPDGTAHLMALTFSGATFQPGSANAMVTSRSLDGGRTWSAPIALISDGASFFNDKNALTADPTDANFVYAVWDRLAATGNGGPTWFARTTNGGLSWEPARPIYDPGPDSQTIGNVIAVLPEGTLVNLFTQLDPAAGGGTTAFLAAIRSTDKGVTWSEPVVIDSLLSVGTTDPETGTAVRDGGILGQIAAGPEGTLAVVWQDARFGNLAQDAIALSVSSDGGQTWSPALPVNPDPTVPAFTPTVRVQADGTIAVSYYDLRNNTDDTATLPTDYWLARSRSGAAWDEVHIAGPFDLVTAPNAGGLFIGDYQALIGAGELLLPFFVQTNSGNFANRTDVFVAPARSQLGKVAPLALTPPASARVSTTQRQPTASRAAAADLSRRVDVNIRRAMQARIPGWRGPGERDTETAPPR